MENPKQPISWTAPEHEHTEKGSDWFIALGIVSTSVSVVAIAFGNTAFAGLILIASITFALFANKEARNITFILTESGVKIDGTMYPYTTMSGFWIEDRYENDDIDDTLIFDTGKIFIPLLVIPIPKNIDSQKLKAFISDFLTEKELHEPFLQKLVETVAL